MREEWNECVSKACLTQRGGKIMVLKKEVQQESTKIIAANQVICINNHFSIGDMPPGGTAEDGRSVTLTSNYSTQMKTWLIKLQGSTVPQEDCDLQTGLMK